MQVGTHHRGHQVLSEALSRAEGPELGKVRPNVGDDQADIRGKVRLWVPGHSAAGTRGAASSRAGRLPLARDPACSVPFVIIRRMG